jgi:hypothetical protein
MVAEVAGCLDAVTKMETLVAICLGIGLSAACGFRVFVPMLMIGSSARADWITLSEGFDWLGSWPAITAFAVATIVEVGAYYVPWLDNALDSIASPSAVIAGIIVAAACIHDIDPLLKWSVAIIAGGGTAGSIKLGVAGLRLGSTSVTGGLGNPIVSTAEWIFSTVMSILSILLPILAAILAVALVAILARFAIRAVSALARRRRDTTGS